MALRPTCTSDLESKLECTQQPHSNLTNTQRRARQQGGAGPPVAASAATCPAATRRLPVAALAAWWEGAAAAGQQRAAQQAQQAGTLFSVCLRVGRRWTKWSRFGWPALQT